MNKLFILFTILLITACTKEKPVEIIKEVPQAAAAVITFESPTTDTVLNGHPVHLKATITGKGTLHGYSLGLVQDDTHIIFYKHTHLHQQVINIDTTWISQVSNSSEMVIFIETTTDHDGNSVGKSTRYIAQP